MLFQKKKSKVYFWNIQTILRSNEMNLAAKQLSKKDSVRLSSTVCGSSNGEEPSFLKILDGFLKYRSTVQLYKTHDVIYLPW